MTKQFDFNQIGKRMPYQVPEGFFNQLTDKVVAQASREAKAKRKKRTLFISIASTLATMAAAATLFFVVTTTAKQDEPVDMTDVEQAFNNLSADDQAYLLAVYQEDVFMDSQQNQ